MREKQLTGLDYLATVTSLLQRVRKAHPTFGSYEAAKFEWWWTMPRSTDDLAQLFWFDDSELPAAAVIATDWGDGASLLYESTTLVVIVMPDATPDWIAHVVERGLAHASEAGISKLELEVDRSDHAMRSVLASHGFAQSGAGLVECWLDASSLPSISPLAEGYRLSTRDDTMDRAHHMERPGREIPDFEKRLQQISLYRPDLDLVVLDRDDNPAGYGLFWHDPVTSTGVVEPMRTFDEHQQRGLARHILTSGVSRLAAAGAERIFIAYEPDNPAAGPLYRSVGFEPNRQTDVFAREGQPS